MAIVERGWNAALMRPLARIPGWAWFVFGLLLAVAATVWLQRQSEAASLGFVFVCTFATVPPPRFPDALFTVVVEPIPMYLLGAAAFWYVRAFRWARERGYGRQFPRWRLAAFLGGTALVLLSVFGPAAAYDHTFLSVHMVQHFLLITLAPPLLLMGAPMTLFLLRLGRDRRHRLAYPLLHSRPFRAFTHPLVGLGLFALVPTLWYVTPAFDASLDHQALHYGGYALFLFAGVHYWWPIVPGNPTRWNLAYPLQMAYLLALVPIHAFLGLMFYQPDNVLYEQLATIPRSWGPSPLLDQQFAGAFMFVVGEALGLAALMVVAVRWAAAEEAKGRRYDRETARRRGASPSAAQGRGNQG
ncbi:hypothetical protein HRbin29_02266 [bacterium HR29]|nr:hypothetical protein HRbin29_02266 [bacterium HR29]